MNELTREILDTYELVEGSIFEEKYLDRASDAIYDAFTIEEIVASARESLCGYMIPTSSKYGRALINLRVEVKGYIYGLGITLERGNKISVNTFLSEGQVEFSWKDGRSFPKFFI